MSASAPANPLLAALGDTFVAKGGVHVDKSRLAGKVIGLYFSAHWCPPCRAFTPVLAASYRALHARGLEVVFISSDRSQSDFDEYLSEMPWIALPLSEQARIRALNKMFKVSGIPTLVLIDEHGNLITRDGRSEVMADREGRGFPWKQPSLADVLASASAVKKDGSSVALSSLAGKTIAFYFSAHWCAPCRAFTPVLSSVYSRLKAAGKEFEVVFVSSDRDQSGFDEYFHDMPWIAVPFSDKATRQALSKIVGVEGIPTLALVGPDGRMYSTDAASSVRADPKGENFPWKPLPVLSLEENPEGINDTPSVLLMMEGVDEMEQIAYSEAFSAAATEAIAKHADPPLFFIANSAGGVSSQIRRLTKTTAGAVPSLVIVDVGDSGAFYTAPAEAVTKDSIVAFVDSFVAGTATRQQMGR